MTDIQVVGVALLVVVPLLAVEATGYVPAGFDSAFWNLPLAEKLPRILAEERRWMRMARVWMVVPAVVAAALFAAAIIALGIDPWVWLGTGLALVVSTGALVMFAVQGWGVAMAARHHAESGRIPDWLEAMWHVLYDLERVYVLGMSAASVAIGIGLLDGGVLAGWVAWSLIVAPTVVAVLALLTKAFFPHMALLGPLLLGVGLVLA